MRHLTASICLMGFLQSFRLASTASVPPNLGLHQATSIHNDTTSNNPTSTVNATRPNYPASDPYDLNRPGTLQTVEFYDYRTPIPSGVIMSVLKLANSAALKHPGDDLIGTEEQLQYWANEVQLLLIPGEQLTWRMWHNAITAMVRFVVHNKMSYGWSFIILRRGMDDKVGWGTLTNVTENKLHTGNVATSKL